MTDIILIHSPLVGPSSMTPTARALEVQGVSCIVPQISSHDGQLPRWRDWAGLLLQLLPMTNNPIIAGHSMGGLLGARLASDLDAAGVICLDANMPPETGNTPAVDPDFHAFLRGLPLEDGKLPKWHDWWSADVFEETGISQALRDAFIEESPRLELTWFDDLFEMPDWSKSRRGFIRTSRVFADEANNAEALGWAVVRLRGTHLHPAIQPIETADAVLECCRLMGLS